MYERELNAAAGSKVEVEQLDRINDLDTSISDLIEIFEKSGLDMRSWNDEYQNLPEEVTSFEVFYHKLLDFREKRDDALTTFEFSAGMSEQEKEKIRQFDHEVKRAYKDHENFLGNGASSEVYAMGSNDSVCIKFITDQEQYNQNNHIRTEFEILSHVYEHTRGNAIKTPYPIFSRIHATDGHSYGMEKIQGASLSQILESPEKYADLVVLASKLDRNQLAEALVAFVSELHDAGVVHCDLYKRNLMLDEKGTLAVIDYGKAKRLDFPDEKEAERKSDVYNAKQSLKEFFTKVDSLTKQL